LRNIFVLAAILSFAGPGLLCAQASARALYDEGGELFQRARYSEAKTKCDEALKLALAAGDKALIGNCHFCLGSIYRELNDYENALKHYAELKKIAEALNDNDDLALYYNNVGGIYRNQGRYADAMAYYDKALQLRIAASGEDTPDVARSYNNIGVLNDFLGKYPEALSCLTKALNIRLKVLGEDHPETATTRSNLAGVYKELGRQGEALEEYSKALRSLTRYYTIDHPLFAMIHNNIADIYSAQRRYREALESYEKALKINLKRYGENHITLAQIYNNCAMVRFNLKEYGPAKDDYLKAIAVVETLRSRIGTDAKSRAAFLATLVPMYENLIATLYRLHDFPAAFHTLELSKARGMLDEVSKNGIFLGRDVDSKALKELRDIRARAAALEASIASKMESGKDASAEDALDIELTREYDTKLKELYERHPRYKRLAEAKVLEAEEARDLLDDRSAILEYSVAPADSGRESFAFVLARKEVGMVQLPAIDYSGNVDVFRETLRFPQTKQDKYLQQGTKVARERGMKAVGKAEADVVQIDHARARGLANDALYDALIRPVLPLISGKTEIKIVPDGELAFLPFEALRDPDGGYLLDKMNISYVQSASLLAKIRSRKVEKKTPILAFGGARYERAGGKTPAMDAEEELKITERLQAESAERLFGEGAMADLYAEKGYRWENLPGTELEVQEIGKLFYGRDAGAHTLTGDKASEETLKTLSRKGALRDYSILHFATHGLVDPNVPQLSALVLSQPSAAAKKAGAEDGYLTMGEVMGLDLGSELVMLSACETGLGRIVSGEGVTGLTQSFLMAGAKNISVTLWSISDEATRDFMLRFYSRVKEGKPYKQALLETKRALLREGTRAEPYYWAPFVLYGE